MSPLKQFIDGLLGRYQEPPAPAPAEPEAERDREYERRLMRAEIETQRFERQVQVMRAKVRLKQVTK